MFKNEIRIAMLVKNKKIISFSLYFFMMAFIITGCDRAVEVQESFTFETIFRPSADGSLMENIKGNINDVLIDKAIKNAQDSVLLFEQTKPKNNMPDYSDIVLFTITSTKQLETVVNNNQDDNFGQNKKDFSVPVAGIDFNKNFVLLIGHPKPSLYAGLNAGTNAVYFDKVIDNGLEREQRKIETECKRLGDVPTGPGVFSQTWKSKIYVLERKQNDSIDIRLDGKIYSFSIKE
jgi:hypothetical protein